MCSLRPLVPWLAILVLAFVNGALRELFLVPRLGYPWALWLSALTLCACIVLVTWWALGWLKVRSASRALAIGALWLVLTLIFEIGFGRLVQGKSWSELLGAYTFTRGNLWSIVLLVILLGPPTVHRLRVVRTVRRRGDA